MFYLFSDARSHLATLIKLIKHKFPVGQGLTILVEHYWRGCNLLQDLLQGLRFFCYVRISGNNLKGALTPGSSAITHSSHMFFDKWSEKGFFLPKMSNKVTTVSIISHKFSLCCYIPLSTVIWTINTLHKKRCQIWALWYQQ